LRKALVLTTALIASAAGFLFWQDSRKSEIDLWDLVSPKALLVFECENFDGFVDKISAPASNIVQWSAEQKGMIAVLSSINIKKVMILVYQASSAQLSYAFIIPKLDLGKASSVLEIKSKPTRRLFNGYQITDIKTTSKQTFSFSVIDSYLVVGPPLMVEDIIRMTDVKEKVSFKEEHNALFQLANLKSDDGNLYINPSRLLQLRKIIGGKEFSEAFATSMLSDVKINQNDILLNGFTTDSLSTPVFLSLFRGQRPQAFSTKDMVPSSSVTISHYSISDLDLWLRNQGKYMNQKSSFLKNELSAIKNKFDWVGFKKRIGGEMAVCTLSDETRLSPIFFLKTENGDVLKTLEPLFDTAYREDHAGFELRKFSVRFVNTVFWPITPDHDLRYCTIKNGYLLFAISPEVLKSVIGEIDADNTIGKSISWNKFISTTLQESTITYFFTGKGMEITSTSLGIDARQFNFSYVDKVAIQFSALDQNFYSSGIIQFLKKDSAKLTHTASADEVAFDNVLLRPSAVLNHTSKEGEIVIQDSLNNFYLVSSGKIVWSQKNETIRGGVEQVDFFKNKKLQYQFVTKDALHIIDRLGRNINGFPKKYVGSSFLFSRAVDYDQSKNYRFLVADDNGSIFLFDRKGVAPEGWNPKKLPRKSIDAGHQRILGKDYFFSLLEDGSFYLFSRTGDIMKNFPVATHQRIMGVSFHQGEDLKSSFFSMISDEGTLFQVNVLGEMLKKEPLLKSSKETHFSLIRTKNKNEDLISGVDKIKVTVFDVKGNLLFEKQNPLSEKIELDYFHSDKSVISIFDRSQNLAILYDKQGHEILSQPLETSQPPVIEFQADGGVKLIYVLRNKLFSKAVPF
jgi:hypothetical protein